jgi:hypothetical protein
MIATITLFLVGCAFFLIWMRSGQQQRRRVSGNRGQNASWSGDSSAAPDGYSAPDDSSGADKQGDACGAVGDAGGGGDCGGGDGGGD